MKVNQQTLNASDLEGCMFCTRISPVAKPSTDFENVTTYCGLHTTNINPKEQWNIIQLNDRKYKLKTSF
jgi:hypothetical protein